MKEIGVAENCFMVSTLPRSIYSFWHSVIPTSYFIFNDFYTRIVTAKLGMLFSSLVLYTLASISEVV